MGAVCCCLHVDGDEEQQNVNTSILNHLTRFSISTTEFACVCSNFFPRRQAHTIPSPSQVANVTIQVADDSACDTFRCPPRPLAYDDPRCSPPQHHGLLREQGKASSHCHDYPDTLGSIKGASTCPDGTRDKLNFFGNENEHKLQYTESSLKNPSAQVISGIGYIFMSSEDEDSCPICLEEYTTENPCITMQCTHEFHLGCLYEWMERSDDCPICGKNIKDSWGRFHIRFKHGCGGCIRRSNRNF